MKELGYLSKLDDRGIARICLNRPDVHNAFDDALIAGLTGELERVGADAAVRMVVIAAMGKSFCAGADLNWMKRMSGYGRAENEADAVALAGLMRTLNDVPKPVIALVQGAALGGGVGVVACCDIAIASTQAVFGLSEVRLGLIPAVISPYVVRAIGARAARRYFLTAERFDAAEAARLGLVHMVVAPEDLEDAGVKTAEVILTGGPHAQAVSKDIIASVQSGPIDDAMTNLTARRIADVRASDEGKEGIAAFLEKRKPSWRRDP
ncbi:MAG: enoyl-CoA hydratase/isomerase family protein [Alphaproteobacteria bacterium]|nr:enoyl-CoA hydratase/isomerase family protein [Alphaproteobacteria bacterium]